MKGDFSRPTFDPARHYAEVKMQQGRVQLDADWNEQGAIMRHRTQTETMDALGRCGGPLHASAFGVTTFAALSAAEKAYVQARYPGFVEGGGNFLLTAGRYYVDGILVENEHPVPFASQPDLPGVGPLTVAGNYLLYLDVWERHLTALEEPSLREIALGGPDTATRARVVWQVRALSGAQRQCAAEHPGYAAATAPSTGRLRMRASADLSTGDPCVVPAAAGYRGLENQLYRVEIHNPGAAVSHATVPGWPVASAVVGDRKITVTASAADLATITVGRAVELYHSTGADPAAGTVAFVTARSGSQVTLSASFKAPDMAAAPRLRLLNATAKWSRDNGVVLARVRSIAGTEVVVDSFGVDDVLSIHGDDWVEIFDDTHDLTGTPGGLYQVASRNDATRTLVLRTPAVPLGGVNGVNPARNPRIRRWDGLVAVKTALPGAGYAELENGVQLRWENAEGTPGVFRTGDWWNAPARTATAESQSGTLEWPRALDGTAEPRLAAGIVHHYCRLGIVESLNGAVTLLEDCRCFFAPATEVNSLAYVSGAGQEAMPNLAAPGQRVELGLPLVVGVPNAHCRDRPASVRFTVATGGGSLSAAANTASAATTLDVPLGPDGLARAWWWMGTNNLTSPDTVNQLVRARLLENGVPVQLPVLFNASLSMANRVSYDPGNCAGLNGEFTVQKAIDRLARVASLFPAGGDGGEVMPNRPLARTVRVMLASECGPLSTPNSVEWLVKPGNGRVNGAASVLTTPVNGFAEVTWTLDPATHYQEVEARINPALGIASAQPTSVFFSATLSTANEVAFTPGERCGGMAKAGVDTVEEALHWLCEHQGGGSCSVTVGEGGDFATLRQALDLLKSRAAVNVCLLPGEHVLDSPIDLKREGGTVRITGSGWPTRVTALNKGRLAVGPLASFAMRDVVMLSGVDSVLRFNNCADVLLDRCVIAQESRATPMITVAAALVVRIAGCILHAEKPPTKATALAGSLQLNEAFLTRMRDVRMGGTKASFSSLAAPVQRAGRVGGGGVHAMQQPAPQLPTGQGQMTPPPVGVVLALLDGVGAHYLEDNALSGYVRLYGPGPTATVDQIQNMVRAAAKARLLEGGGALHLRGNLLYALRVDATAAQVFASPTPGTQRVPFRACALTDNSFADSYSQVVAAHHSVAGNQWIDTAGGDLLVSIGMTVTVTGNTAAKTQGDRVFAAASGGRVAHAANLLTVTVV